MGDFPTTLGTFINRHPEYNFPNDESESDRLDLQHNLWLLTLHGELGLCPKVSGKAKRVLDAGTGTGLWAIEYGEMNRSKGAGNTNRF